MAKQQEDTAVAMQQLKVAIREKNPERLYFFHGEETFLLQHYLSQLKKLLVDDLTESFNYHKFTAENFQMQTFADAVENLPMMAENTMVWVDEVDIFKLPEPDRNKLAEIICDIAPYCTVVFTYVTTPWKPDKRLKKLWAAVETYGTIVEFAKQSHRDLVPWITRHFAAHKKQINKELCVYLIEITGGTMTALATEISKICAYSGAIEIKKSDIDAVTEPVLDAEAFRMTDLISQGESGAALGKLQQLFKMQEEPVQILGAIGLHFRRLAAARILHENGKNAMELQKLYNMPDSMARRTMAAAGRVSSEFCKNAVYLILETDRQLKTSFDSPQRLMEILVVQLSREARYG